MSWACSLFAGNEEHTHIQVVVFWVVKPCSYVIGHRSLKGNVFKEVSPPIFRVHSLAPLSLRLLIVIWSRTSVNVISLLKVHTMKMYGKAKLRVFSESSWK
jgi:hypothetical protein